MLTRILFIGLAAGAIAGAAAATVQAMLIQPQIVHSEALEAARAVHHEATPHHYNPIDGHTHDESDEPSDDPLKRQLATVIAIVCAAVGYGLMLSGMIALGQGSGWRFGLLLGVIGFVSMQLAPSLGVPPEPPGFPSHDVHVRQLWWLLAAACTAAACLLGIQAMRVYRPVRLALCGALAFLPHVARPWLSAMGPLPELSQLTSAFALSSYTTAAVLWLSLGAAVGALHGRGHSPS